MGMTTSAWGLSALTFQNFELSKSFITSVTITMMHLIMMDCLFFDLHIIYVGVGAILRGEI